MMAPKRVKKHPKRSLKMTGRRGLSLFLSLVMMISLVQIGAFAAAPRASSDQQITTQGTTTYWDAQGKQTEEDGDWITSVTKHIDGTDTENKFKITLDVQTTFDTERVEVASDTDVVLVLDVSNSMADCAECGQKKSDHYFVRDHKFESRLSAAKRAAKEFIDTYGAVENGGARNLSIVAFGSDGETVMQWRDVSKSDAAQYAKRIIDGLEIDGGTNTHAGMMLARNLLRGRDASPYVVLLTDGEPTYAMTNSDWTNTDSIERDGGLFWQNYLGNGMYSSDALRAPAAEVADQIKNPKQMNATLYTICYDHKKDGNNAKWLHDKVASDGCALTPENAGELEIAFDKIAHDIKVWAEAYIVTDPMSPSIATAKLADGYTGRAEIDHNNVLTWNVKGSPAYDWGNAPNGKDFYAYKLEYYIWLNNSDANEDGKIYDTNGTTTMTYVQMVDGKPSGENQTATFTLPQVKAYVGQLSFTKQDPAGNPVKDALFTLTCQDCRHTETARSNSKGQVTFSTVAGNAIPSGHTYTMTETVNGYQGLEEDYVVDVNYGVVSVTKNGNPVELENLVIVNKHDPVKTSLTITKEWLPSTVSKPTSGSITVALYNGETLVDGTIVLSAENNWTTTISVPTKSEDDGTPITYTVRETGSDGISGYEPTREAFEVTLDGGKLVCTVTNVRSGQDDITVTKKWVGPAQGSVTLGLIAQGATAPADSMTVTLSESNNWTHTFENVDLYNEEGEAYDYFVAELADDGNWVRTGSAVIGGQTYTVSTSSTTVTNTIEQDSLSITGRKAWVDGNNEGNTRPASMTVTLYADGEDTGITAEVNTTDWTFTFGDSLPKYALPGTKIGDVTYDDTADGHEIVYTVEDEVNGYTMTHEGNAENGYTVTNALEDLDQRKNVEVTKIWEDDTNADNTRPDSVTLILQRSSNGQPDKEFNEAGEYFFTFEQGREEVVTPADPETGAPAVTEIVYEDKESHKFEGLNVYDKDGYKYTYTVIEQGETGYKLEGNGVTYAVSYNGTTVINSLDEASATTQVTVHKNWIGTPADSVTIRVLNGTEIVGEAELNGSEATPWTHTFTDLPKYEDGKEIQYTVEEDEVSGYTASAPELKDGIWNITNTIEQDSVTVAVEKFWNEGTAATPNSVTFTLYADEQALDTITLDASTGWSTEISGLPRYAIPGVTEIYGQSVSLTTDGHAIRYTVEEVAVEGFTQTQVSRTETDGRILYQFTNQFDAGTVHFQVAKSWNDLGSSGSRPASIWVGLFANGTYLKNLELTADNNWVGEFSYLPQYSDVNVPITYTVREMTDENDTVGAASGDTIQLGENTYAVTIVDGQITNTIEGDSQGSTVTYSVDKVWNGPSSTNVSFGLYAGVNASDPVEVIPAENMTQNDETHTWSATFAPVPKFDSNGNRINYVVKEIFTYGGEEMAITSGIASIDGISYTVSSKQTGNNIILTNTVNETNDATYSVKKVWANIGEGVNPPDSVQVQLYADGVKVEGEEVTLNAENDWGYTWTDLQKYNSTTHMPIVYSVREVNAYEVTTLNEGEPLTHVIFIHGNDYYDVTYGEDGTITNTYNHSDIYSYRVDRVYNYYVDGTLDSTNTVTGTRVTGEKDETVTISDADKDSYKQTDGRSEYTFVSGGPVLEDGATIGVTLDEANLEYVITLTYEYRYTTPDEPGGGGGHNDRTVTVYYREEGTRAQLADTEQREYDYGDAWDVTDLTDLAIDGYVITRVEGDTSGDRLTSNKTVTVWYSNDETDIEDPDTPTTDLPDGGDTGDTGDTGNTGDPGDTGDETDIGDEDVPLAEAPETGDASLLWVILAIASGSGLIWLALTGKKRKECEEQ